MLDAKSAREKAVTAERGRSDAELETIEHEIIKACNDGRTHACIGGKFLSATVRRLKELGYTVEWNDNQRDGTWTTISW